MGFDAEGYGFPEHDRTLARLMSDIRVMGPAGVERAAQGWDDFAAAAKHSAYHEAERAATHAIEQKDRGPAWDALRSSLFAFYCKTRTTVWRRHQPGFLTADSPSRNLIRFHLRRTSSLS